MQGLILKIDCPDQHGIVAKIASYVADHEANLCEFSQFTDDEHSKFFARVEIDTRDLNVSLEDFSSPCLLASCKFYPLGSVMNTPVKSSISTIRFYPHSLALIPIGKRTNEESNSSEQHVIMSHQSLMAVPSSNKRSSACNTSTSRRT